LNPEKISENVWDTRKMSEIMDSFKLREPEFSYNDLFDAKK
jgi:hypothetical protein